MGNALCCDCFGLHMAGPVVPVNESRRQYGPIIKPPYHDQDPEQRRYQAAAAAEARLKSQEAKGLKNSGSELKRLQDRQARIEKAEAEAAKKGGFDNKGGLKWQMN